MFPPCWVVECMHHPLSLKHLSPSPREFPSVLWIWSLNQESTKLRLESLTHEGMAPMPFPSLFYVWLSLWGFCPLLLRLVCHKVAFDEYLMNAWMWWEAQKPPWADHRLLQYPLDPDLGGGTFCITCIFLRLKFSRTMAAVLERASLVAQW